MKIKLLEKTDMKKDVNGVVPIVYADAVNQKSEKEKIIADRLKDKKPELNKPFTGTTKQPVPKAIEQAKCELSEALFEDYNDEKRSSADGHYDYDAYLIGRREDIERMLKANHMQEFIPEIEDSIDDSVKDATINPASEHAERDNRYYSYVSVTHPSLGSFYVSGSIDGREVRTDGKPWDFIKKTVYTTEQIAWIEKNRKQISLAIKKESVINVADSINDSKFYVGISKYDYTKEQAEEDAKKYNLTLKILDSSTDGHSTYTEDVAPKGRAFGLKDARFIWHGEWADPEIEYKEKIYNYYDIEDYLWSLYEEDCEENGCVPNADDFSTNYIPQHNKGESCVVRDAFNEVPPRHNVQDDDAVDESCTDKSNLSEMNDKELSDAQKGMKQYAVGKTEPGMPYKFSDEGKRKSTELSCIDMINSVLAYGEKGLSAEEVLARQENGYHNYLKDYINSLGRERVIELIQGQIDDMEDVDTDVYTDSEGVTYNSIRWKKKNEGVATLERPKTAPQIENLPDDVYTLVYDRLFPGNIKYRPLLATGLRAMYDEEQFYTNGLGVTDIGVAVVDKEDADLAKSVANELKLDYELQRDRHLIGDNKFIAIIHIPEDISEMSVADYYEKIGKLTDRDNVRMSPSLWAKQRKVAVGESAKITNKKGPELNENVKIISDLSDFKPWSDAVATFDKISDEDKMDEFDSLLEELYPDGINETDLNDLLRFESDWLYEQLGIEEEGESDEDNDEENDED